MARELYAGPEADAEEKGPDVVDIGPLPLSPDLLLPPRPGGPRHVPKRMLRARQSAEFLPGPSDGTDPWPSQRQPQSGHRACTCPAEDFISHDRCVILSTQLRFSMGRMRLAGL
jgi:hypothetical protein